MRTKTAWMMATLLWTRSVRGKADGELCPAATTSRAPLVLGLILVLGVASIAAGASSQPSAPNGLLVNGVSSPLAIDRDTTRFTWQLADRRRGERQTACQIMVASSAERLSQGMADYWDSGKKETDKSASVEYAGRVLPPASRVWWQVRIWDQSGQASPYSAPARFDTGLSPKDWTARYLWDGTTNPNNFAYFRKTFSSSRKPAQAKVYISAHNDYLLYVNGQLVGRGPARCDPYHNGQYNAYDITRLVRSGTNVFAALAHWEGQWNDSGVSARPAFLLEARLTYPDGSTARLGTDESWKVLAHTAFIETNAAYTPIVIRNGAPPPKRRSNPPNMWTIPQEGSPLPPEFIEADWGNGGASNRAALRFDARLEPPGWRSLGFDDSGWASATVVERSNFHLFAQMAPAEQEQAQLKPVSLTYNNAAWLADFGRCLDGWPKVTLRANHPGDVVRLEYFQMTGERKPAFWDEYTCRGGTETWDADFGRHASFQVIKVTGAAGKLRAADVRGMWAYSDADVAGRFHCSSPLLDAIYTMCERSARQNVQQAIISVDANREQSPWTADSWNIGNVLLYNHRDTMMLDKVVRDYGRAQMANGDFPACCPAQRSARIPEWSMYWPMLLWQQYLFSGDETLLREMTPRLTHFLDWLKPFQDPATGLLNPPLWRISDYAGGNMPSGGYNVATACQYYENLSIAARVFLALGDTNQCSGYRQQAEQVKAGINAHLFNGQYYLARTDRKEMFPLASAWPLRFGIVPEALKAKVLAATEQPAKLKLGGYGGDALYSGLLNAGGGAFVVRDLARYRPMLEQNQANWESFDFKGGAEVNHAWTAYPGYLFQKYILGVQPTSGGFATFDVRPETGGLTFAEGTVPTVKGLIQTRWEKTANGGFTLLVDVPANTQASIYVPKPAKGNFTLTESGQALWPATWQIQDPGVLAVSEEAACIKCLVGAGAYRFSESMSKP